MDEVSKDPRFRDIGKDPRFRKMPIQARKVKIDNRFQGMFKDKSFKLKYTVDKRGRPIQATTNENLRKFYELSTSEEDSDDDDDVDKTSKKREKKKSVDKKIKKEKKKEDKTNPKANKDKTKIKVVDKVLKEKGKKSKIELKDNKNEGERKVSNLGDGRFNLAQSKFQESSEDDEEEEEEEEDKEEDDDSEDNASENASASSEDSSNENDSSKSQSDSDEESNDVSDAGPGIGPDYARGEGLIDSSTDEEFEFEEDKFDHQWGEIDKDAQLAEKSTSRLALCNMDWDRIKARDIMMVLNSFTPPGGVIHTVSIYPSEFGAERMKEENAQGPRELREMSQENNGEDITENEEGSEYHREKLRQYQLNRLKYYYAVAVCDSAETANAIYEQCDGMEYETSSTKLDLRFIPEDMTFDQEPKSVANDTLDASTYKPTLFSNSALNQSKVDLTWDETDRDRLAVTMRKITKDELEELDVKDYLASSSDEEAAYDIEEPDFGNVDDSDEDSKINKYKLLVQGFKDAEEKKEDKDLEMEISWEPGLKETTEKLVKKKKNEDDLTPWEQYLEKKKDKKRKKRDENRKKREDEENDESGSDAAEDDNDNLVSDDELPDGIDLDDPYFKEEMEKSGTATKKGKESKDKKGKKKKNRKLTPEEEEAEKQKQAELQLLMMDEDDQKQHFNLKNIQDKEKTQKKKKKRKMKKKADDVQTVTDTFEMDVSDTRFKEVYSNPVYNIDPSAPEFKKTKSMDAMIQEKLKRRKDKNEKTKPAEAKRIKMDNIQNTDNTSVNEEKTQKKDASLASLVKSVKAKTNMLKQKKSKK